MNNYLEKYIFNCLKFYLKYKILFLRKHFKIKGNYSK